MTEEDIKLNYITPAIQSKWANHITMETRITDGRVNIKGNLVAREKPKKADYVLYLNKYNSSKRKTHLKNDFSKEERNVFAYLKTNFIDGLIILFYTDM